MNIRRLWNAVKFGDVVELRQGLCFNKKTNFLMADKGIPLLRIADLINGTETKFVDAQKVPRRFISDKTDIIYTRTGQVGLVFKGRVGIVHNNCFRVVPREGISRNYVYWYLKQQKIINYARTLATGAAQPDLSHTAFKSIPFNYPDFPTQCKISAILSAYDDLIENNLRRVKILEEMAQNLYTEWFVKFRFPGHEKVNMVNSSLGSIPDGWKASKLDDLVNRIHESTVPGDHLSDRLYVPIDCIPKHSLAILESEPWDNARSSLQLFDEMDILFGAMRPYFHKVAIAPFKGITRTTCFVLRPRDSEVFSYSVMTLFQEKTIEFATKHSQGSTIPYVAWEGVLANMPCLEPPDQLLKTFNSAVYPIMELIHLQYFIQKNLRLTRDLLLPRLISGELDVSDLDIKTGDDE